MEASDDASTMRLIVGRGAAYIAARLTRWSGRGGGTTLPGRVLLAIAPGAIRTLGKQLPERCAIVSATNGKTTTSAMAATILADRYRLAHNRTGANLASGIASTLVATWQAELGLFEVDEAALPRLSEELAPRALVLGNLFRDQLDRYGELETIADNWRGAMSALPSDCVIAANADDARIVHVVGERDETLTFGIDDPSVATGDPGHASDARTCFVCAELLVYESAYVGHLGDWHCSKCASRRPPLAVYARDIRPRGLEGTTFELVMPGGAFEVELDLPGLYNVYNALAAASLAHILGIDPSTIAAAVARFRPAFGRVERIEIGDRRALLLLAKNPAGANEVVRTVSGNGRLPVIVIALNDDIADGRDVSWIWDVDFERLMPHAERIIASGSRAEELALRFKYGGYDTKRIEVTHDLEEALDRGLELTPSGAEMTIIPTYTAMIGLQRILTDRGLVKPYWDREPG